MLALKEKIKTDLIKAIKSGDKEKRNVLRELNSQIKNLEIEKKKREEGLSEEEIISILTRLVKQHKESIKQYSEGKRDDLVVQEEKELKIIQSYLPQPLTEKEILDEIKDAIKKVDAQGPQDLGRVMSLVMGKNKGRVDGNQVRELFLNYWK